MTWWPLVWRSTYEREMANCAGVGASLAREIERCTKAEADLVYWKAESIAALKQRNENANERVRAEVRTEEWKAIAMELIARGAGRPKVEGEPQARSKIAAKIREESGGDPQVAAHFQKLAARMKAEGKSEDEIVGAIGWETTDPEPAA